MKNTPIILELIIFFALTIGTIGMDLALIFNTDYIFWNNSLFTIISMYISAPIITILVGYIWYQIIKTSHE